MSTITNTIRESKEVHFLVDLNFNGLRKRYADSYINIIHNVSASSAYSFDGKILSISNIINSFDLKNFKYSLQNVSITISNSFTDTDNRLQDEEYNRVLDGSNGNIYIWSPGLTWEDIESDGLIYSGIFQKQYHDSNVYVFNLVDKTDSLFSNIPNRFITEDTFPNFKLGGTYGIGASGGEEQQIIFGNWPKGVKLQPIDTTAYLMCSGNINMSEGSFYPSVTETLYAASGTSYSWSTSGVSIYKEVDGQGNLYTYVKFQSDQSSSEPLHCSMEGILESGTTDTSIKHPSDIIEYITDNYSNVDSSEIDKASIVDIEHILPGLKYTTCINKTVNASEIIDRLLCNLLCARINKIGGRVGVMIFNRNNIVKIKYDKSTHCISSDIKISKTAYTMLCNDLTIKYGVNIATSKYEKSVRLDRSNNALCKLSYYEYGKQPERVLTIPDIWDDSTASILAKRYLEFYSHRHDLLEWEVSYEHGFDIVEGDAVTVTLPEGSSRDGNGWIDEKCILLQRRLKQHTIEQLLWRIDESIYKAAAGIDI